MVNFAIDGIAKSEGFQVCRRQTAELQSKIEVRHRGGKSRFLLLSDIAKGAFSVAAELCGVAVMKFIGGCYAE